MGLVRSQTFRQIFHCAELTTVWRGGR